MLCFLLADQSTKRDGFLGFSKSASDSIVIVNFNFAPESDKVKFDVFNSLLFI